MIGWGKETYQQTAGKKILMRMTNQSGKREPALFYSSAKTMILSASVNWTFEDFIGFNTMPNDFSESVALAASR
jgi:hypothetical protein